LRPRNEAVDGLLDEEFHVEGRNDHGDIDLVRRELMHGPLSFRLVALRAPLPGLESNLPRTGSKNRTYPM
jgi:hypothetical protein